MDTPQVERESSIVTLASLRARRGEILRLAEQHRAYNVRVFGSVARGESDTASDVDLLVSYRPDASLIDVVAFWQDVQDLLGCKVDVVDDQAIKPRMRRRVLAEAVPLN